jgi:hypothetical protein
MAHLTDTLINQCYLLKVVAAIDFLSLAALHFGGCSTTVSFCKLWTENGGTIRRPSL